MVARGNRGRGELRESDRAVVRIAGDLSVTFPSRNIFMYLASPLDPVDGDGRPHHESIINGYYDTSRPIVFERLDQREICQFSESLST
jgi:hypothetical protein